MHKAVETLVSAALAEDIGQEDLTTNTVVSPDLRCRARLYAKQDGVLSGMKPFRCAFDLMDTEITGWDAVEDGRHFAKGDLLVSFEGRTQPVLTAERTAMNFLQHLSGVATVTARFVAAVSGLNCKICGTRKTTPLMRQLEKAAIVHGGGSNHRHTLFNGILIKENHIMAAGGIHEAVRRAWPRSADAPGQRPAAAHRASAVRRAGGQFSTSSARAAHLPPHSRWSR